MASKERRVVEATDRPLTVESLVTGLRSAGLMEGQTVLVHGEFRL